MSAYCRNTNYEVISLDEGKSYSFRVFAENTHGRSIPLETEMSIITKNPYGLPGNPHSLQANNQTSESVEIEWRSPVQDGGSKILGYNLEMNEHGSDDWYPINDHIIRGNTFTVNDLRPGVKYNFRVKAKNSSGWGPVSRENLTILLKPDFVKPDSPEELKCTSTGNKFANLEWSEPKSDGGSRITGYLIEKKPIGSEFWHRAAICEDTKCQIDDLIENGEYEFRVKAINKAGESETSNSTGRIKITEYPDGVRPEFLIKPTDYEGHIGGTATFNAKFTGKPKPNVKWLKNGYEIYSSSKYDIFTDEQFSSQLIVNNLNEADNYSISCVLINPLGKETCEIYLKIKAIPKLDKDQIDQYIDAGENLKLKLPINGRGPFKYKLHKNGLELNDLEMSRLRINELDGTLTLVLPDCKRDDEGQYTLTVSNDSGSAQTSFKLKVKGPPGPPTGPIEVTNLTKSGCHLAWKAPKDDGGNRVLHYVIEKRDLTSNKQNCWQPYTDHCKDTHINVQGLTEMSEYEFRVMAVNHSGQSEPLYTSESFIAKFSFNVPDAPGEPELVESGSNFVNLTWTRPESDGGDSITGYWIEKKEKGYDKWIRTNTNQIQSTSYIVTNLYENRDYEFRVLAENQAGLSEPSKTSKLIQVKDPNAASVPKFSVHLQDTEAGLGKTAHFECQIVASQTLDVRFFKDTKELFHGNKYKITKENDVYKLSIFNVSLDDHDEYSVKAKTKAGSKMSRASLIVQTAPKIKLPERYSTTVIFEKEENVMIKIPFTSNPLPTAKWYKDNEEIKATASSNYQVEISNYCATLKINKPTKIQSGAYKLVLTNPFGSDSCEINIQIAGKLSYFYYYSFF